jgi:pilus assembly protein CpaF
LKNGGKSKSALKPEYQELKFTLHRKLVDKINLEALATIDNQRVRSEVRQALISLIDSEPTLLSSLEKQQICDEVLDEVFGLGPLEPLLQDPTISDILVNTHRQVYIERKGLLELTSVAFRDTQHLLRIIDKIVSRGRLHPHGGCAVERRLACERHYPSARRGRAATLHSPLQHRQADAARPGGPDGHDAGHDGAARSGSEG